MSENRKSFVGSFVSILLFYRRWQKTTTDVEDIFFCFSFFLSPQTKKWNRCASEAKEYSRLSLFWRELKLGREKTGKREKRLFLQKSFPFLDVFYSLLETLLPSWKRPKRNRRIHICVFFTSTSSSADGLFLHLFQCWMARACHEKKTDVFSFKLGRQLARDLRWRGNRQYTKPTRRTVTTAIKQSINLDQMYEVKMLSFTFFPTHFFGGK